MFSSLISRSIGFLTSTQYTIGSHSVTVVKQIAEGGFSYVYLAKSTSSPHTTFALKKIHCQTREQLTLARSEVAAFQRCQHEGVSRLIDHAIVPVRSTVSGEDAHDVLMLFPYYSHGSLQDLVLDSAKDARHSDNAPTKGLKRWPWDEDDCLVFFLACCEAVQAIHKQGFTHRDIKPLNVLLSPRSSSSSSSRSSTSSSSSSPRFSPVLMSHLIRLSLPLPVLIDLGSLTPSPLFIPDRSAALTHQDHAATHTTASYRPPELWQVKVGVELDGRVDVWMLGCVLYWLSTGRSAMEDGGGVSQLKCMAGRLDWEERDIARYSAAYRGFVQGVVQADYGKRWVLSEAMQRAWDLLDAGQAGHSAMAVAADWATFDEAEEHKGVRSASSSSVRKPPKSKRASSTSKSKSERSEAPIPSLDMSALAAALAGDADDSKAKRGKKGRKERKEEGEGDEDEAGGEDGEWADFQSSASFQSASFNTADVVKPTANGEEGDDADDFSDFSSAAPSPTGANG